MKSTLRLPLPAALGIIAVLMLVTLFQASRAAESDRLVFAIAALLLGGGAATVLRFGRTEA